MLNVAMVSKWHVHAADYARTVLNSGKAKITAVWDEEPQRGADWAAQLGAEFVADYDALLSRPDVDAIVCDSPTSMHEDLLVRAAKAGKHIFTEKALAPTVAASQNIAKAVSDSGITFVMSFPQLVTPVVQFAKKLVDAGEFGKISLVRIRNGHSGVSAGWLPQYWFDPDKACGGAMMDFGCHPLYTANHLLGKPVKIVSIMTSPFGTKVDEAATASVLYENGAVFTAETSFVSYNTPGSFEIYGSDATLLWQGSDVKFISKKTAEYVDGYAKPNLPQAGKMPLNLFIDACIDKTGSPQDFTVQDGVNLTLLLENSYISHNSGKVVNL